MKIVLSEIPWWAWTMPVWLPLMSMCFVLLAGWLTHRSTGRYPSLSEWCAALNAVLRSSSAASLPPAKGDRPVAQQRRQTEPAEAASREGPSAHP